MIDRVGQYLDDWYWPQFAQNCDNTRGVIYQIKINEHVEKYKIFRSGTAFIATTY